MYRPVKSGRAKLASSSSHLLPPAHLMNGFNALPSSVLPLTYPCEQIPRDTEASTSA